MEKKNVLMCCSHLSVKGGMVSVLKNYLNYNNWEEFNLIYIPTHIEKNKILVAIFFLFSYIRILILVLTKKVDIAHLHVAERGSFYRKAIIARTLKKFGIKVVFHHHAAEFELFYDGLSEKHKKFVSKTLEDVDVNIVLSNRLVEMILSKASKATVKVLYNAVEIYENNPYDSLSNIILFLGRLGQRKGTYDFLEAIKKINMDLPSNIQVFLCGDGEVDNVKSAINKLGIENRVGYIGWIELEEKKKILKKTLINVLPSYNEGLPMSILECMAAGIPNISTEIASIPEVIYNGENGFLIKPGDIDVMAERILQLVNNEELRCAFSTESFDLINQHFSLQKHVDNLKNIYLELIK